MSMKYVEKVVGVIVHGKKYLFVENYTDNKAILEFPKVNIIDNEEHKSKFKNYFETKFVISIKVKEYITTIEMKDKNKQEKIHFYFCEFKNKNVKINNENIKLIDMNEFNDKNFERIDKKVFCYFREEPRMFNDVPKELDDLLKIYFSAKQFEHAVPNSYEMKNGKIYNKPIPFIVNTIFACELYLKLILMIQNKKYVNSHGIYYLLKNVKLYDELMTSKDFSNLKSNELEKELLNINNAFTEWRYSFESKKLLMIDQEILFKIIKFLDNKCRTLMGDSCASYLEEIDKVYL